MRFFGSGSISPAGSLNTLLIPYDYEKEFFQLAAADKTNRSFLKNKLFELIPFKRPDKRPNDCHDLVCEALGECWQLDLDVTFLMGSQHLLFLLN